MIKIIAFFFMHLKRYLCQYLLFYLLHYLQELIKFCQALLFKIKQFLTVVCILKLGSGASLTQLLFCAPTYCFLQLRDIHQERNLTRQAFMISKYLASVLKTRGNAPPV